MLSPLRSIALSQQMPLLETGRWESVSSTRSILEVVRLLPLPRSIPSIYTKSPRYLPTSTDPLLPPPTSPASYVPSPHVPTYQYLSTRTMETLIRRDYGGERSMRRQSMTKRSSPFCATHPPQSTTPPPAPFSVDTVATRSHNQKDDR